MCECVSPFSCFLCLTAFPPLSLPSLPSSCFFLPFSLTGRLERGHPRRLPTLLQLPRKTCEYPPDVGGMEDNEEERCALPLIFRLFLLLLLLPPSLSFCLA